MVEPAARHRSGCSRRSTSPGRHVGAGGLHGALRAHGFATFGRRHVAVGGYRKGFWLEQGNIGSSYRGSFWLQVGQWDSTDVTGFGGVDARPLETVRRWPNRPRAGPGTVEHQPHGTDGGADDQRRDASQHGQEPAGTETVLRDRAWSVPSGRRAAIPRSARTGPQAYRDCSWAYRIPSTARWLAAWPDRRGIQAIRPRADARITLKWRPPCRTSSSMGRRSDYRGAPGDVGLGSSSLTVSSRRTPSP